MPNEWVTFLQRVFTYSDQEHIGSAQAQITVGNHIFNVFVNHPAGEEKQTTIYQQQQMVSRTEGLSNVIFIGDFNFCPYSIEYNVTVAVFEDSWMLRCGTVAENNIDHIFLSSGFTVLDAQYVEEGQSDHPAYWIRIQI
ncbi:MAG: hypothetical protein K9W46_04195 [Candidatus Heimdallarchaeum endolithica]|uniref:Endonuclease/exonuclease/phosphatase domain-containing protein n=1 Tax=Candidatus Heimdallarchaeum endolithica TaxID=2876572 RepID=A0A9Y1BSS8_9ARCH|nr:MAG: hypothetical protein K9W46_04195 [Candidatus Heimdallarchaeum endolithica]